MKNSKMYFRGCLLGGAIGDAYGYPVEDMNWEDIVAEYGADGLLEPILDPEIGKVPFADDTQMTTFTVDGLLWADSRAKKRGIYAYIPCLFYAYQKWLYTQTGQFADEDYKFLLGGEVLSWKELFANRGSGNTSMAALAGCSSGRYGTLKNRINNSKGCGAVMRAAPIGLYFCEDPVRAFNVGCESGAITHGNASGFLPAGFLAHLIALLVQGMILEDAVMHTIAHLQKYEDCTETYEALMKAVGKAKDNKEYIGTSDRFQAEMEELRAIGGGWTGESVLACAVYCALHYPDDYQRALWLAVNNDGNSGTIAAICGNIMGTYLGWQEIPYSWILNLEASDLMVHGADMLLEAVNEK